MTNFYQKCSSLTALELDIVMSVVSVKLLQIDKGNCFCCLTLHHWSTYLLIAVIVNQLSYKNY